MMLNCLCQLFLTVVFVSEEKKIPMIFNFSTLVIQSYGHVHLRRVSIKVLLLGIEPLTLGIPADATTDCATKDSGDFCIVRSLGQVIWSSPC